VGSEGKDGRWEKPAGWGETTVEAHGRACREGKEQTAGISVRDVRPFCFSRKVGRGRKHTRLQEAPKGSGGSNSKTTSWVGGRGEHLNAILPKKALGHPPKKSGRKKKERVLFTVVRSMVREKEIPALKNRRRGKKRKREFPRHAKKGGARENRERTVGYFLPWFCLGCRAAARKRSKKRKEGEKKR